MFLQSIIIGGHCFIAHSLFFPITSYFLPLPAILFPFPAIFPNYQLLFFNHQLGHSLPARTLCTEWRKSYGHCVPVFGRLWCPRTIRSHNNVSQDSVFWYQASGRTLPTQDATFHYTCQHEKKADLRPQYIANMQPFLCLHVFHLN